VGAGSGCQLASTAATAYPVSHMISGYPLKADPASYCQFLWKNGNGRPWGDLHTAKGVQCAHMAAHGSDSKPSSFPRCAPTPGLSPPGLCMSSFNHDLYDCTTGPLAQH